MEECFLRFLVKVEDTASSMSPTKLSSFNAVSEIYSRSMRKMQNLDHVDCERIGVAKTPLVSTNETYGDKET